MQLGAAKARYARAEKRAAKLAVWIYTRSHSLVARRHPRRRRTSSELLRLSDAEHQVSLQAAAITKETLAAKRNLEQKVAALKRDRAAAAATVKELETVRAEIVQRPRGAAEAPRIGRRRRSRSSRRRSARGRLRLAALARARLEAELAAQRKAAIEAAAKRRAQLARRRRRRQRGRAGGGRGARRGNDHDRADHDHADDDHDEPTGDGRHHDTTAPSVDAPTTTTPTTTPVAPLRTACADDPDVDSRADRAARQPTTSDPGGPLPARPSGGGAARARLPRRPVPLGRLDAERLRLLGARHATSTPSSASRFPTSPRRSGNYGVPVAASTSCSPATSSSSTPSTTSGIYLGDGLFVDAPHTGAFVRIDSLSEKWYAKKYVGARRIT